MNIADINATIAQAKETILEQRATISRYEVALREIHGHLGCCIVQRASSDDKIIAEHIEAADKVALEALHGPTVAPLMEQNSEALLRFVMFGERP